MSSTTVIQFNCPDAQTAQALKTCILEMVNAFSAIPFRMEDPEYVTRPFGMELWHEHLQTPGLYWADYGAIHMHIGNVGRQILDRVIGTKARQGLLSRLPLAVDLPESVMQLVEVDDLVAQGYIAAPVVIET